ncbi:LysR family transcriptional regulator [Methylorubrum suomiense]
MLDLASVRLFILAVEFGNLTRAAEAAGTVQPVVSARIKGLEAALGRKLLERTPRFVRPTEDGLSFLAKARALLAAHDDAMRFDDAPTVRFVIGASDHALGTGLEHVIRHVRAALPLRSAVELRLGLSQQVRTAFDEGELDAVIIRREAGARTARCWVSTPRLAIHGRRCRCSGSADPPGHAGSQLRGPLNGGAPSRCRPSALARSLRRRLLQRIGRCGAGRSRHRPDGGGRLGADERRGCALRPSRAAALGDRDVRPCQLPGGGHRRTGAGGCGAVHVAGCVSGARPCWARTRPGFAHIAAHSRDEPVSPSSEC